MKRYLPLGLISVCFRFRISDAMPGAAASDSFALSVTEAKTGNDQSAIAENIVRDGNQALELLEE